MAVPAIVKSGGSFLKGASVAIAAAAAAVTDPLKWLQAFGLMTDQQWIIEPWARQAIFAGIAFLWMFIWYHRQRVAFEERQPAKADMPLHRALHYLAKDSRWAASYHYEDNDWPSKVGDEFMSKFRQGQLQTWGKHKTPMQARDRVEDSIPASFAKGAMARWDLLVTSVPPHHFFKPGQPGEGSWSNVRLCRAQVEAVWPSRSFLSKLLRRSPVERIDRYPVRFWLGGYRNKWAQQNRFYRDLEAGILTQSAVDDAFSEAANEFMRYERLEGASRERPNDPADVSRTES